MKSSRKDTLWLLSILAYLIVDYGRPQDILPIGSMRPGLISVVVLSFFLITSNKLRLSVSKQTNLIWYFIFLTGVYILFAKNNFFAYQTTRALLLFMPFILSTIIVINSKKRLEIIIDVLIALMLYVSFYSLFHSGQGSGNYMRDENDLALFINAILPFPYFLVFHVRSFLKKIMYVTALLVGILALVLSFSRGGFIGFILVALICWINRPKKVVSGVILVVIGFVVYFYGGQRYFQEIESIKAVEHGTAKERLELWRSAWHMFLDNPLGVGGNNFQVRIPEYQTGYFQRGMWGKVAHSTWFTLLAEEGIVGLFIYLRLMFLNFKDIRLIKELKSPNSINNLDFEYCYCVSRALFASFIGFFAAGSFLSVLYYPHYWYLTAVVVATERIAVKESRGEKC